MTLAEMLAIAEREAATGEDGKKRISQTTHSGPWWDGSKPGRGCYEPRAVQCNERDEVHYRTASGELVTLASEWRIAFPDKCKQCGGIARGDECGMSPPCRRLEMRRKRCAERSTGSRAASDDPRNADPGHAH